MMTTDKKLAFLHKMAKLGMDGIPHYDLGGAVAGEGLAGAVNPSLAPIGAIAGYGNIGGSGPSAQGTGIGGIGSNVLGTTNNFQPSQAQINPGVNQGQLDQAYSGAQNGINMQNWLSNEIFPGVGQALNSQSALSNQLANEANGQGPNPAQAALNQSTGQNINAQAALQASQRGAGANAGMVAANAARQGAETQQQAIGQSATLQAQQQIAAQQQQQQLAAQQVGQSQNAVQATNQAQQNEQNILQNANTAANNANVSSQGNINSVNGQVAAGNQAAAGNVVGGILSGASSALGSLFADGGYVHKMADGGSVSPMSLSVSPVSAPQSMVGQYLNSGPASSAPPSQGAGPAITQPGYNDQASNIGNSLGNLQSSEASPIESAGAGGGGAAAFEGSARPAMIASGLAKGGKVMPMRKALPPMHGKNEALIAKGGRVRAENKSEKAVSNKDDYANDKVPALLSEGEVVIDKNTLNDPGPMGQMARTLAHHLAMKNASKGKSRVQKP